MPRSLRRPLPTWPARRRRLRTERCWTRTYTQRARPAWRRPTHTERRVPLEGIEWLSASRTSRMGLVLDDHANDDRRVGDVVRRDLFGPCRFATPMAARPLDLRNTRGTARPLKLAQLTAGFASCMAVRDDKKRRRRIWVRRRLTCVNYFATPPATIASCCCCAFSSAWSTLNDAGFCRGGNSLNVLRNSATIACAGMSRNARSAIHLS